MIAGKTYNGVIDGPESVELEGLDIPVSYRVHVKVRLIAHHVIHKQYVGWRSGGEGSRSERSIMKEREGGRERERETWSHRVSRTGWLGDSITKPGRKWSVE